MEQLAVQSLNQADDIIGLMPWWLTIIAAPIISVCLAVICYWLLQRLVHSLPTQREKYWPKLIARTSRLIQAGLILFFLALLLPLVALSPQGVAIVRHGLFLGFMVILTRVLQLALNQFVSLHLRHVQATSTDTVLARKHITQARVLQRIGSLTIAIVGISAMLMTFETVRQYGISLLASAGAVSLIIGFSLQSMLKNLFAGIQLAITQPIRIGDSLFLEGDYGQVEEITSTYVVVRTWDRRRLIVPLNYFIEKPFQNWTRDEAGLTGEIKLYVDYGVNVEIVREKAKQLVSNSALWDGKFFSVKVSDLRVDSMEISVIASGANASAVAEIKAFLREELVAFLTQEFQGALPSRNPIQTKAKAQTEFPNK